MDDGSCIDLDDRAIYSVTYEQIRDLCDDAIKSGRLPSEREVDNVLWEFTVRERGYVGADFK